MGNCPSDEQLSSCHDGELPVEDRARVEAHIASCGTCAARLSDLRAISALFSEQPAMHVSRIGHERTRRRISDAMDRGLLRTAVALAGMAAAVLLAGTLWLAQVPRQPEAAPPWVEVPLSVPVTARLDHDVSSPAATWYLADASSRLDDLSAQ